MPKRVWLSAIGRLERRDALLYACPSRRFLGARCPGCGIGHATLALLRGDWKAAYRRNPLAFIALPLLVWGVIDVARQLRSRSERR